MKWAGKPKRVKITFNGRTEGGKYIKPFCPEQEERKRKTPAGASLGALCPSDTSRSPTARQRLSLKELLAIYAALQHKAA